MSRFLTALFFIVILITPSWATEPSAADKQAFEQVISGQLEAFKVDDGPLAYSYAAPVVTKIFPTVDVFMAMVKRGYQAVYTNSKYRFGELTTDILGRPAQHVTITAGDGKRYEAVYAMEKQPDGSWKIAGVQMVEIPGLDA